MNIPIWLVVYFAGMIPAVFLARQSVRMYHFEEELKEFRRGWNFWEWIVFPFGTISRKLFHSMENYDPRPISEFDIVRGRGETGRVDMDGFCQYIVFTMFTWPIRVAWTILILFVGCLIGLVRLGILRISPLFKRFARL